MPNIHIDVDPAEIGKNMQSTIPLVGNARVILGQLMERGIRVAGGDRLGKTIILPRISVMRSLFWSVLISCTRSTAEPLPSA